ncbi:MAG TPA: hypothetical protein VLT86_11560 [Vicinamibacterales bacterium]|nr:hypothetical protein [Vicinamibacterales bacterium]
MAAPSTLNAAWHRAHRMPKNATLDQRVRWHAAHARHCGCRDLSPAMAAEIRRRGIAVGKRPHRSRP